MLVHSPTFNLALPGARLHTDLRAWALIPTHCARTAGLIIGAQLWDEGEFESPAQREW